MDRKRVLIIEDQREIARLIHSAIQIMDPSLDVLDTLSAEEAALELKERGADLLIVDVRLPGISGLQLLERWRRQNLNIPVIVTTGFADPVTRAKAEKLGAKAFFAKPLPMEEFLGAVQAILSGVEYRPGEDRTGNLLTQLRQNTGAEAVWLCQESGQVALRAGDVMDADEFEFESIIQQISMVQRKATAFLGPTRAEAPSILLLVGEKRSLVLSPLPSGAHLALFFQGVNVNTGPLRAPLADASTHLEGIFRYIAPAAPSGAIPMPDWVRIPQIDTGELHLENTPQPVEPAEAKTFWDDAALEAGGFLSPGKLTFEEAEKLGLAPGEKPGDPYRVLK